MSAPARRCTCGACTAKTLHATLRHIENGRPAIAAEVLKSLLNDLPLRCGAGVDPRVRQLQEQLIEAQGWAMAYKAQERARIALGAACPCLARKSA